MSERTDISEQIAREAEKRAADQAAEGAKRRTSSFVGAAILDQQAEWA